MDPSLIPEIPEEGQVKQEEPLNATEPLDLDIKDNILADVIQKKIDETEAHNKNKLKLPERRKRNYDFWRGDQLNEAELEAWQYPHKNNLIWQDLEHRISIAAGRMPDIIVTPADNTPEKKESARKFEKILDIKVKNDVTKRIIKDGLRDLHNELTAAVKVRWDKNKGENGDFIYELVRPGKFGVDYTATIPHDGFTADNAEVIYEWIEEPIAVVLSKFPDKKDELKTMLGRVRDTEKFMLSKLRYLEIWFTWYSKSGKPIEGTAWKYKDLILGKEKNSTFDYEGYEKASEDIAPDGSPIIDQIFRNHFDRPRKPYMLFTYQNTGKGPVDDTSAVEQAIPLQKSLNKTGRQILEISDNAVPKKVFAGKYISKEEARRVTSDPEEHIWLDKNTEDVRLAVTSIRSDPPSPALYQNQAIIKNDIDSKFSTHGTSRGETQTNESGVSKQITREGDLVASDDMASIVVERVVYEMSNWAAQMMKVNYDKNHVIKDLGREGNMVYEELSRDRIDDGIAINVKASSVDKQTKRADALALAARKAIDPMTMYEDLDYPNPKERAKRLILFLAGAQDGYARYMEDIGVETGPSAPAGDQGGTDAQQAALDISRLEAGEDVQPEAMPTPEYMAAFKQYVESGALEQQPPEIRQRFAEYLGRLSEFVSGQGAGAGV